MITPYELWTKRKPNLNYLRVWGYRAVVRLLDPKLKTLGERGIECIFVGYAKHSEAFRFYVIEPNEPVIINSIIESRDAMFDKNRLSSVPRPRLKIPSGTEDVGDSVRTEKVTEEVVQQPEPELRKSKRNRTLKDFGPEFQFYLIEGTRDEVSDQHFYCFNVEEDPKTFDEAMKLQTTWLQMDLQKKTEVACISTIRLLIAMTPIYNLIIHHMDVKTTFLNGELDEEVYMNQPQGFIMPGNENKVCKLIKSLYGLKQAPKQWHQKFDEVIFSNVDDMLIFGTGQVHVDLTKEFLSSRFSMKDMGKSYVILGIRIKHKSNGILISHSHYIEKVLKKFNYFDCTPLSTPMDTSEKLVPNNGQAVSQLEYSRVIECLMYTMTCTRPNIEFVVGKLSWYTSNPVLEGYTDASWISNTKDNSSTSGWVFLLGGGKAFTVSSQSLRFSIVDWQAETHVRHPRIDMGLFDYIRTADPRKVQAVEVQKGEEQVTLLESIKHCFVSLDAPAAVHQASGSGSGVGLEVSVPSAGENVVAEENVILVGTYVDLIDPEDNLTVVEKGDAAQKQPEKAKRKKLSKQNDPLPAKRLRVDHPSLASGTGGKTLASLRRTIPEGSLLLGTSPADVHTQGQDACFTHVGVGGSSLPETSEESTDSFYETAILNSEDVKRWSRTEHELELKEKLRAKYDARGVLLGEKDAEIARLKSLVKEKETESAEVLRLRDQVSVLAADKSLLSAEVSAFKSAVLQKDTDISLLDSRASYLKSALDDSQAACDEARNLISSLSSERDGLASEVSTLHSAFRDFKEKMEAHQ
ncbi:zinc finger, CCHC-type containing protein, partial [Tanacetum coccineum]